MTMETVSVPLPGRAYDVVIGPDLIDRAGAFVSPLLRRPRVAVLTDETVAGFHLKQLEAGLAADGISIVAISGHVK